MSDELGSDGCPHSVCSCSAGESCQAAERGDTDEDQDGIPGGGTQRNENHAAGSLPDGEWIQGDPKEVSIPSQYFEGVCGGRGRRAYLGKHEWSGSIEARSG